MPVWLAGTSRHRERHCPSSARAGPSHSRSVSAAAVLPDEGTHPMMYELALSESFTCPHCKTVMRDSRWQGEATAVTARRSPGSAVPRPWPSPFSPPVSYNAQLALPLHHGRHEMLAVDWRRQRGDRRPALRVARGSPATRSHIVDGAAGPEAGVRGIRRSCVLVSTIDRLVQNKFSPSVAA
jgi:hypothetical protein